MRLLSYTLGIGALLLTTSAVAQNTDREDTTDDTQVEAEFEADLDAEAGGETTTSSSPDERLSPPGLEEPDVTLEQQAGTGGTIAFARAGVFEVGGGGNVEFSDGGTFLSLRPFAGWFVIDNVELTAIVELSYAKPDEEDGVITTGLFAEPSFHLPFTDALLGFIGVGIGFQYTGEDAGFALRPRVGMDVLVGRSGIFRPYLDLTWTTVDVVSRSGGTLVGVSTSFGVGFSFSVML